MRLWNSPVSLLSLRNTAYLDGQNTAICERVGRVDNESHLNQFSAVKILLSENFCSHHPQNWPDRWMDNYRDRHAYGRGYGAEILAKWMERIQTSFLFDWQHWGDEPNSATQHPCVCKSIKEKLRMSKIIKMTLVAAAIFSLSSCAAYNSIMPDWATGSKSAGSQDEGSDNSDAGDDLKWWNPITWF